MTTCSDSCYRSPMLGRRNPRLMLLLAAASGRGSIRFRCVLDHLAPRLSVSSSLGSIVGSANVIAAAEAGGTGAVHAAVTSTLAQVAVTAVAIASGACLSTKVNFLWPRVEERPGAESYSICKQSTLWAIKENWRA